MPYSDFSAQMRPETVSSMLHGKAYCPMFRTRCCGEEHIMSSLSRHGWNRPVACWQPATWPYSGDCLQSLTHRSEMTTKWPDHISMRSFVRHFRPQDAWGPA